MTQNTTADPQSPTAQGRPLSGFLRLIGVRRTGFAEGWARLELDLRDEHMNPMGIPHGGIHATMLDTALGTAGSWQGDEDSYRPSVTLNLNVSYLAQPRGKRLICEARRVGGGRSIYFSEGELRDDTGIVLARASGTFRVMTPR